MPKVSCRSTVHTVCSASNSQDRAEDQAECFHPTRMSTGKLCDERKEGPPDGPANQGWQEISKKRRVPHLKNNIFSGRLMAIWQEITDMPKKRENLYFSAMQSGHGIHRVPNVGCAFLPVKIIPKNYKFPGRVAQCHTVGAKDVRDSHLVLAETPSEYRKKLQKIKLLINFFTSFSAFLNFARHLLLLGE